MFRKTTYGLVAALGLTLANVKPADAQVVVSVPGVRISAFGPGPNFGTIRHFHVQYRDPYWRERSFPDGFEAREFARYKESQGYEVDLRRHGFHFDVRYRLTHWQSYRTVPSHAAAHDLERMLEYRGYQARIVHH